MWIPLLHATLTSLWLVLWLILFFFSTIPLEQGILLNSIGIKNFNHSSIITKTSEHSSLTFSFY